MGSTRAGEVDGHPLSVTHVVEEVLLLNMFFFRLSIRALVAKIQPDKVVRRCTDDDF